MKTRTTSLKRLAAGAGALSLAMVGLISTAATAAPGDDPVVGNIDSGATGSIMVHKHEEHSASEDGNPAGDPIGGVEFTVQEVLLGGSSVPLATAEGWDAIDGLSPGDVPGNGFTLDTGTTAVTDGDGEAPFTGLNVGFYLVTETASGPNLIATPAAPFFVAIPMPTDTGAWDYDVDAYPKNILGDFTPTKTAGDHSQEIREGATALWTIGVPVPAAEFDYESLTISDVIGAGMTFDSWVSVSIDNVALDPDTDYEVSADNSTVTLLGPGLDQLNAITDAQTSANVTAVIRTTIDDIGVLENTATVTLNGKPVDTPSVSTNWGALHLTKVDDGNNDVTLPGAVFELRAADSDGLCNNPGDLIEKSAPTADDGVANFEFFVGNNEDTTRKVCVVETVAPAGYVLPANAVFGPFTIDAASTAEGDVPAATWAADIENHKAEGPNLPLTGSTGTLLFTIVGIALIATGGTIAAVRHSRSKA
ncbi:SpaH/EbpB family LPXTG-anchored major pilin [Pseudactinotalea sp. HY158]|uniref:SpaH/EbpB family LPXTG-anchored major pilin n=1 Tax=Pseudactinotalea sp. HY158 TaxID=2654547 RepID=UPI0018922CF8|nr:SpaH/EbpB family LPXTG-anchored major pilin [Pseudactinotalea sp. HY158]